MGSYSGEHEADECDEKIKEKQDKMVAMIAENAKEGSYMETLSQNCRRNQYLKRGADRGKKKETACR